VEDPSEEWQQLESDIAETESNKQASEDRDNDTPQPTEPQDPVPQTTPSRESREVDVMDVTVQLDPPEDSATPARPQVSHATSEPLPIPNAANSSGNAARGARTPSPVNNALANGHEGPITPRNDAGPWVFDGSAGRRAAAATANMRSLDAAAEMEVDT
jgi:E3 ubiquitin-protein ligase DMA1/2